MRQAMAKNTCSMTELEGHQHCTFLLVTTALICYSSAHMTLKSPDNKEARRQVGVLPLLAFKKEENSHRARDELFFTMVKNTRCCNARQP